MNPRLTKLRELLTENNLDALLVSSLPNIIYLTDFSDFTGTDREGFVLITQKNQYIFTYGLYKEAVQKKVPHFTLVDITRENPINEALKNIILQENIKKIGFEPFDLTVSEYERLLQKIDKKILVDSKSVNQLRIIKSNDEIHSIKQACALGDKAFSYITKKIKQGISETALSVELEFFIKKNGAALSFDSVIAFGTNASKPHHIPSSTTLQKNEFVLMDFGIKLDNYCSDMTRTIFFGNPTKKQEELYYAVLNAQKASVNYIKNTVLQKIQISTIDQTGRDYLSKHGYEPFNHSSHGIGLNVHESPHISASKDTLENGMVFSIEPGTYLPGEYGIRIEDIFAFENDQLIQLTTSEKDLIKLPIPS